MKIVVWHASRRPLVWLIFDVRQKTMISNDAFRDEVIRQLKCDILSFGWLRQMAELEFGHPVGVASRRAVFDLACALVDSGVAVVGHARNDGKMVSVYPWCERGESLKERMARDVDGASPQDQDWVLWLQLSDLQKKPNKAPEPTTVAVTPRAHD